MKNESLIISSDCHGKMFRIKFTHSLSRSLSLSLSIFLFKLSELVSSNSHNNNNNNNNSNTSYNKGLKRWEKSLTYHGHILFWFNCLKNNLLLPNYSTAPPTPLFYIYIYTREWEREREIIHIPTKNIFVTF